MIPAVLVCYLFTVLMYTLQALMFIHELVHLPKEGFGAFRFSWNAACGIHSWYLHSCTIPMSIIISVSIMVPNMMANTWR